MATFLYLADVDGTLCVAVRAPDYNEPKYVTLHFPTKCGTRDFCAFYECKPEELRERFRLVETMPGEYRITTDHGKPIFGRACEVSLVSGARTLSALATSEPVPVPRVAKSSRIIYDGGRWHIYPVKGKRRVVEA